MTRALEETADRRKVVHNRRVIAALAPRKRGHGGARLNLELLGKLAATNPSQESVNAALSR